MTDPIISIVVWRGPLSALAARQRMPPALLLSRIRARGLRRGNSWEVRVESPTSMATLRRVLSGEATE